MFNTMNFPASATTKCGSPVTLHSADATYVWGFVGSQTCAWYHNGEHAFYNNDLHLVMPLNAKDELAKVEGHFKEALTAFNMANRKITGIKFLRTIQMDAGRPYGLTICKEMYELHVMQNPSFNNYNW